MASRAIRFGLRNGTGIAGALSALGQTFVRSAGPAANAPDLMRQIKAALDLERIFNPGKIFA